ncbi:hypothetical protein ACH5RR_002812 [Cinchona calisaya]|uniref:TF-B3 domain-containing protein n=1 Tax=Cinchona calisaya TaxID=153742 RepID=A0ABD3ATF0_9GENT
MVKRLSGNDVHESLTIPPTPLKVYPTEFLNDNGDKIQMKRLRFPLGCGRRIYSKLDATLSYILISKEWKDIAEKNHLGAGETVHCRLFGS